MKKINLILLLLLSSLIVSGEIHNKVLLYSPFDERMEAYYAIGSPSVGKVKNADLVPGRVGQGLGLTDGIIDCVAYYGNFNPEQGTVAFWYNPSSLDGKFSLFSCGNLKLAVTKAGKMYFMAASRDDSKGFQWNYSVVYNLNNAWKPNQWYHIAMVYNAVKSNRKLYINGVLVSTGQSLFSTEVRFDRPLQLGGNATGVFDELIVWDAELSDEQIHRLYAKPEDTAKQLKENLKMEKTGNDLIVVLKPHSNPVELILTPGSSFKTIVELENKTSQALEKSVVFKLEDIRGKTYGDKQLILEIPANGTLNLPLEFKLPEQRGAFKIAMYFGATVKDVAVCASWPEALSSNPDQDSFFGNHVRGFDENYLRLASRLGLGWTRVHDMLQFTWWNLVQPENGEFTWSSDHIWNNTVKYKMPVLGCLTGSPTWALLDSCPKEQTSRGRGSAYPPKIDAWRNYVRETVRHYSSGIKYWEVYNEPAVPTFWRGTPEQLVELTQVACQEIRKNDKDAQIMASGFTFNAWQYHEKCAKAGLFKDLDIVSFHYCPGMEEPEITLPKYAAVVNHFKRLWKEYGPANRPFRAWSTESALPSTTWFRGLDIPELPDEKLRPPINAYVACKRIVQGVVIMQGLGVEKHFYYWFGPLREKKRWYHNTSMIDVTGAPRPKQLARLAMEERLKGFAFEKLIGTIHGRFRAGVYQNRKNFNESVVVWWAGDEGRIAGEINWPGDIKVFDIMGNPLALDSAETITDEPVYLQIAANSAVVVKAIEDGKYTVISEPVELTKEQNVNIPELPDYVIPSEMPSAGFFINLKPQCNMGFADAHPGDAKGGWSDEGPMNDMRDMPIGVQTFYGVPFDIIDPAQNNGKSVITLQGQMVTPKFVDKVLIPVGRRTEYLYFLHAASCAGRLGKIGNYIINYEDGTSVEIPNQVGKNNGNWWTAYYPDQEESKPVSIGASNTLSGKKEYRYPRVFEWFNPFPKLKVNSIEVISLNGRSTPILIAITGYSRS